MKKLIAILVISLCAIGLTGMGLAQTTTNHDVVISVGDVNIIALNNTSDVTLTVSAPGTPGDDPVGSSDATKKLQYTSIVASGLSRIITVDADANPPAGTGLTIEAAVPAGMGTTGGSKTLSLAAGTQNIITGVGSCATGTGANGATLTYTLSVSDKTALLNASTTITATFTILDDA